MCHASARRQAGHALHRAARYGRFYLFMRREPNAVGYPAVFFLRRGLLFFKKRLDSSMKFRIPSGETGQIKFRVRQHFNSRREADWLTSRTKRLAV